MTLLISDVLPAIASGDEQEIDLLRGHCEFPDQGPQLGDLPAVAIVAEFSYDSKTVQPPLAAALGRWIVQSDALSHQDFGMLLPDLERAGGDPRHVAHLSAALRAILVEHHVTSWQLCGRLTSAQIVEWAGPAHAVGEEFVVLLIRQAALAALGHTPRPLPSRIHADLSLIAAWGSQEMAVETLGQAFAVLASGDAAPAEIREAWGRIAERPLLALAGDGASAYDLDAALQRVLQFGPRQYPVASERLYAAGARRTLDDLGQALSVTRERVRQIEKGIEEEIERRLHDPANAIVRRAALRLQRQLGTCISLDEVPAEVRVLLTHDAPVDNSTLPTRFLLHLAGPYELFERWVVRAPAERLIATTSRELEAAMEDRVVRYDDAEILLRRLGIPEIDAASWLETACDCRVLDGRVMSWKGSMADKSARILAGHGEPLAVEEIVSALGPETNARSLLNQIQADQRFLRRGKKHYGLRSWGGEEYTKISDEIEQEIERQGGAASLDYLVRVLCEQFGVSETSVRAYAASPPFVRTAEGLITVGVGDTTYARRAIEDCRGCFRVGAHWAFRTVVDSELLRGSGRVVPVGVPQLLGIRPGESRYVATPVGDLQVRYARQATLGSLRKAALHLDCVEGDRLFVSFTDDATGEFVSVTAASLEGLQGIDRLARELGAELGADAVSGAAYALGLPPEEYSVSALRRRLVARNEDELLPLIADVDDRDADDDVLGQLIRLGE